RDPLDARPGGGGDAPGGGRRGPLAEIGHVQVDRVAGGRPHVHLDDDDHVRRRLVAGDVPATVRRDRVDRRDLDVRDRQTHPGDPRPPDGGRRRARRRTHGPGRGGDGGRGDRGRG